MKVINPNFEEIRKSNPLEQGEVCARVCYKSENLIKEGSAKRLLTSIANAGHTAMLEHISVYIFTKDAENVSKLLGQRETWFKYSIVRIDPEGYYISTNLRVIYEHDIEAYLEYMDNEGQPFEFQCLNKTSNCKLEDSDNFVNRITIRFTMDRVGSQSFCRHRVFSFAQESTRFVNYMKEKFGSEISVIQPCWLKPEDQEEFEHDMALYEGIYFKWLNKGYKAEEARAFLPFDVKTEIIMTGFPSAWIHFFSLRHDSHAHSQAQELAGPLEEYFKEKKYI